MISNNTMVRFQELANRRTLRLTIDDRDKAGAALLLLDFIRQETLEDDYLEEALAMLQAMAPSLALHLREILKLARAFNERTSA